MTTEQITVQTTTTPDGIAYDRAGHGGRPVILVDGLGQMRAVDAGTRALTTALAERGFDVVHHDRPGRGDSAGEPPFTLAGEVAALRVLVDELGGRAALYGSSSGAAIALAAAAAIPGVDRLVLWEIPLDVDADPGAGWAFHAGIVERAGDPEAALRAAMGFLPPEVLDGMLAGPDGDRYRRLAPTTAADAEALARALDGLRDGSLAATVTVPTTLLTGTSTWPFMAAAADALAAALPDARRAEVPGADHAWEPDDMAAVLASALG
ncbi:alpha/beta fold hydrolase [Actinomycetospora straminea]|uniref:AB hydrolase-1 domain-containing protein n=1 Tax=Actinomycetospora straminea TaxID=663607 RepID=A0ABP9DTN3_9PSEU|nr:alpha/beta hydrolase [Actinomycetospora straminea]MDD7935225.1 alpha/beta hydrolase [Actinomycetospora straminea]